jgi:photosystem II stability/assembly factor-like uncharacterized protein
MKTLTFLTVSILISSLTFAQGGWQLQNSGTNKFLTDVSFIDKQHGWISGWTGTILYTTDGGENWNPQTPPPNNAYESIFFTDILTGWAVGYGGYIIHTTNGGSTWDIQWSGTSLHLQDVFFLSQDAGWVAGGRFEDFTIDPIRQILHTEDGGTTWVMQYNVTDEVPLFSIHFVNESTGYAVGDKGTIMKSTNGGADWTILMSDNLYQFRSVFFVDADNGWVAGHDVSLDRFAIIYNTTDGGTTWNLQTFGAGQFLEGVFFVNENYGWAVGGANEIATILHTSNGGISWVNQDAVTTNALSGMSFTDDQNGWAVGYDGTIIHTSNGGTVGIGEGGATEITSDNFFNLRNYPDPAIKTTTIEFELPEPGKVNLSLFNQFGQQVEIVMNCYLSTGLHQAVINASALPGGAYYYRLTSNGHTARGKLIIVK